MPSGDPDSIARDAPVPTYSEKDDGGLFARIEQASGLQLPILNAPTRPGRKRDPSGVTDDDDDDKFAAETEAYNLQIDILNSFFASIQESRDDAVTELISRGFVSPDVADPHGETPLLAAVRVRSIPLVRLLVSLGATVDKLGRSRRADNGAVAADRATYPQRTPLQLAAETGSLAMVRVLREDCGADDAVVAPDGALALRLAAVNGHREVVDYLPLRRGGAWLRWKTAHRREMRAVRKILGRIWRFVTVVVWVIPKCLAFDMPKEMVSVTWKRRHRFPAWCKRQLVELPGRLRRTGRSVWKGIKATPEMMEELGRDLVKVIKAIPRALHIVLSWLGRGLHKTFTAIAEVVKRLISVLHTATAAAVSFFRDITLKDVWDGFCYLGRAIFINVPKALWSFVASFGKTSYDVLAAMFGGLGECLWYVACGLLWLAMYVPRKSWQCLEAIGRSIRRGFQEVLAYIDPKRVSRSP